MLGKVKDLTSLDEFIPPLISYRLRSSARSIDLAGKTISNGLLSWIKKENCCKNLPLLIIRKYFLTSVWPVL